jgi:purine-binding chemotaxis protein CheW
MCVSVAGASYGLPLGNVQEVIGLRPVTRVFHAPPALAGIINLRGEVLPVLDLAELLRAEARDSSQADARIVVVRETEGLKRRAGLCVDALLGLLDVPLEGLGATPSSISAAIRALVAGVISTSPPCAVFDVPNLLSAPDLALLTDAQQPG